MYGLAVTFTTLLAFASLKSKMFFFTFLVLVYAGCPGKEAVKWVSICLTLCVYLVYFIVCVGVLTYYVEGEM